ncbi:hypothetical protein EDD29_8778 [Actinocorallia herbida]|uniref:Uncharacterized protein n=1 Tax=Actinocorallia herbida TaxID=58109 RepID=A0A3N1DBY6_9ACTN|nr:hypothetical protein EDD29_8778 [Actinocorallia herbida]
MTAGAVAVLALNDHLLKPAFPGVLTGKLSDVAGLVFAPALLALAFAVSGWAGRRTAAWSVVLTGIGFALVKATSAGADAASALWTAVAGPSVVLADPTDLLALPALGLSWAVHLRTRGREDGAPPIRFVRVLVVVPLAVLATAATSAPPHRSLTDVRVVDGRLVVSDGVAVASRDGGRTWEPADPSERPWTVPVPPTFPVSPSMSATPSPGPDLVLQKSACVPSEPAHCYRVVSGRLAVQETLDGRTWRTSWEISEGRRDFLRREALGRGLDPRIASSDLAVQEVPGGHVVAVANLGDGLALRNVEGDWRRLGFPKIVDRRLAPVAEWQVPELADSRAYRYRAAFTGLIVLALALGAGLRADPALKWGVPLTVLGAALGVMLHSLDLLAVLAAPVALGLVVAGLVLLTVAVITTPDARRAKATAPVALVTGVLTLLPLSAWAMGVLDHFRIAALATVLLGGLGVAAAYLVGRAVGMPREGGPPVR